MDHGFCIRSKIILHTYLTEGEKSSNWISLFLEWNVNSYISLFIPKNSLNWTGCNENLRPIRIATLKVYLKLLVELVTKKKKNYIKDRNIV